MLRLALIYSLIDGTTVIDAEHLAAASAIWDYAARSVAMFFGSTTANPLSEQIHAALVATGTMSRTDIRDLFSRNRPAADIDHELPPCSAAGGPDPSKSSPPAVPPSSGTPHPHQPEPNKPGSRPKEATTTLQPQKARCDRSVLTPAGANSRASPTIQTAPQLRCGACSPRPSQPSTPSVVMS